MAMRDNGHEEREIQKASGVNCLFLSGHEKQLFQLMRVRRKRGDYYKAGRRASAHESHLVRKYLLSHFPH